MTIHKRTDAIQNNRRSLALVLLFAVGLGGTVSLAQNSNLSRTLNTPSRKRPSADDNVSVDRLGAYASRLTQILGLVRSGQCLQAAPQLYSLSRNNAMTAESMQIKFLLGTCLSELHLYQTAAFQFVDVIRNGGSKYVRQSIERLSVAADALGDDTLLNYAISKVHVEDFPTSERDLVYFRLGEIKLRNGRYGEAAELFNRVQSNSRYSINARFNLGLAYLEGNRPAEALPIFQSLHQNRIRSSVTDVNRVATQMAIARTYYQMQDWDNSIAAYLEVPRDSEYWHDALFEASWAELRAARFRTVLSNLQSLHSPYYKDAYIPESLLVRAIVYLYVCKFDETDKVLNLFEKEYGPVKTELTQFLSSNRDPLIYFSEVEKANMIRKDRRPLESLKLPYMLVRFALGEGNVKRSFGYLKALTDEKNRMESMPAISRSSLGSYALRVLANRFNNAKIAIGELVHAHLTALNTDLTDFFDQATFIRYEMINGRKELLKKKIAGKEIKTINEDVDRVFYVQNGYQYWPFDGEYWLDEIGNYHYLGQQSCE